MSELSVWRERHGDIERVGAIRPSSKGMRFSYDLGYNGQPISVSLPMQQKPFDETADALPSALEEEADSLVRQGFPAARIVFGEIIGGVQERCAVRQ